MVRENLNFSRFFSGRFLVKVVKPVIIWLILIYILLQLTVIFKDSDSGRSLYSRALVGQTIQQTISSVDVNPEKKSIYQTTSVVRAQAAVGLSRQVGEIRTLDNERTPEENGVSSTCPSTVKLVRGFQRKTRGYLTIGITTVPRERITYLPETLQSLLDKMLTEEKKSTVIVLYIASTDEKFANATLKMVDEKFSEIVTSGILQVIQPEPSVYPDFSTITKRNFNDTLDRVHWRTKQNIDFATIFAYCDRLSNYYIHVEDDVIAATGYIDDIRKMVDRVSSPNYKPIWFELDFSTLGFIGRLYRSTDLCMMKKFLLLFQIEKPCDILMNDLKRVMMQPKDVKSPKSLFQHVGRTSSLKGKIQNLTDKTFKDLRRVPGRAHDVKKPNNVIERDLLVSYKQSDRSNPPGKITTNMETFADYNPIRGYSSTEKGFYWAKSPIVGSNYKIVYNTSVYIDSITVRTGHPKKFVDSIDQGSVRVSTTNTSSAADDCGKFLDVGNFVKGQFYVHFNQTMDTKCIEIVVTAKMKSWLIISEINIETNSTSTDSDEVDETDPGKK